jgi:hypothetical protein
VIPGHSEQELKAKQLIPSGQSLEEPEAQGSIHDESASSFVLPQKKVVATSGPGEEIGAEVESGAQSVNGIQDSPESQSLEEPDGHAFEHFSLASSRSTPQ